MNEVIKNLTERRSVKSYNTQTVPKEILEQIIETGKYAPSGRNLQASVMVCVTDKDTVKKLSKLNAAVMGADIDPFYNASTVIIVFADSTIPTYIYDGSLVMGNLMNAAYSLGVSSCWIHRAKEVFMTDEGKELMKKWELDEKYVGIGNCILGYTDSTIPDAKPRKENYVIFD